MQNINEKRKTTFGYWSSRLLLVILAIAGLFPLVLTIYLSTRNNVEVATAFWDIPQTIHWNNYKLAFDGIAMPVLRSLLMSATAIVLLLMLSSSMSYVFARMEFVGKEFIYTMYTVVMMIPGILTIAPLFMMVNKFHLLNTWWAIILPYIASWQVLGIIIMRNNYKSIPESLFEAARVEGAGDYYCFTKIALPLNKPILITIAITALLGYYNDYIWPALVLSGDKKLFSMFIVELGSGSSSDIGVTSAAYVIGSIPLIAITASCLKYYLQGALAGAIKE